MKIDFGKTASDYARYRAGFPQEFFDRLGRYGVAGAGNRALDLGSGTGTIARGLALRGCEVTALDRAQELLVQTESLSHEAGVTVRCVRGVAEALPFADGVYDLVTAGQCWHWFDRPVVAAEAMRLLQAGGTLVIAHFDWLALPGNVVTATEALVVEHNPGYGMSGSTGFYPQWVPDVMAAGFSGVETFSFDVDVRYSHEGWRGRVRACNGVGASLNPQQIKAFDAALKALLEQQYEPEPLHVPHRVFAIVARKPD